MNILVIGAGRVGSTFAFHLARAEHTVSVLARGARLAQLQRDGAIVSVDGRRAPVSALDTFDTGVAWDLVLVTVMRHQLDALMPALGNSAARAILFLFNSFDATAQFRHALGSERFAVGFPNMLALLENGKLRSVIDGPGMVTTLDNAAWAALLKEAGMPTEIEPDMDSYLRSHVALVVPLMLAGQWTWQRDTELTWREARLLTAALVEGIALVRSLGHTVTPRLYAWLAGLPAPLATGVLWLFSRSSGVKDLGQFGPAEVRMLIDAMVAAGPGRTATLASIRP